MMNISLEISSKSLCKHGEELCGDTVEIIKTENSDIIIYQMVWAAESKLTSYQH